MRGSDVCANRDVHTDITGGARQNCSDQKADSDIVAQEGPNDGEYYRADDSDRCVLAAEIGLGALTNSAGDFLHACIASICRHHALNGINGVDDRKNTASDDPP